MKKMFIAALLCGAIISFNNISSVEAATDATTESVSVNVNLDATAEMQQLDAWSHLRNKIFGGKRKDDNHNDNYNGHHHQPTPRHDDHNYNRPPHHPGYGPSHNPQHNRPNNPPPPPPHHR
ncbi:MAG: hypothetical protein IJ797_00630 [Selenomonadaceae bacterium]|nr:hypothetical protein [Selenomonadaceae bacterium]